MVFKSFKLIRTRFNGYNIFNVSQIILCALAALFFWWKQER